MFYTNKNPLTGSRAFVWRVEPGGGWSLKSGRVLIQSSSLPHPSMRAKHWARPFFNPSWCGL